MTITAKDLIDLGYTPIQAQTFLGSASILSTEKLNELHARLIVNFTHAQIVAIATPYNGKLNLEVLAKSYELLKGMQLNNEQIYRIAAERGGFDNIRCFIEYCPTLQSLNYSVHQIIEIAAQFGGHAGLIAVKNFHNSNNSSKFSRQQIVSIVAHWNGANNLLAVNENLPLISGMQITSEQLVAILGQRSGAKNLIAIRDCYEVIADFAFTAAQLVTIINCRGSFHNVIAISDNYTILKKLGINAAQIVELLTLPGGAKNLKYIANNYSSLEGKEPKEIIESTKDFFNPAQRRKKLSAQSSTKNTTRKSVKVSVNSFAALSLPEDDISDLASIYEVPQVTPFLTLNSEANKYVDPRTSYSTSSTLLPLYNSIESADLRDFDWESTKSVESETKRARSAMSNKR